MNINYEVLGKGKKIVLLHGWGGSIDSLGGLQKNLASNGFEVYNLDLPGFGNSELLKDVMTLDDYVEFLHDFISELKIEKPIILGHSFGGKIAAKYASKFKDGLSYLILVNASGINPKIGRKKIILKTVSKIGSIPFKLPILKQIKPVARKLFYKFIVRESDYLKADNLRLTFLNIINSHIELDLVQIKVPTLLLWAEKDTYTPLSHGQKMATLIPKSRLEVVANTTHNLPLKYPEVVAGFVKTFIK